MESRKLLPRLTDIPSDVADLCRQIERWRQNRRHREPMPARLWAMAANLAREHTVARIARFARLDYYALRDRLDAPVIKPAVKRENSRRSLNFPCRHLPQAQSALLKSNIHDAGACASMSKELLLRIWPPSAAVFGVWSHDSGIGADAHSGGGGAGRFPMRDRRSGTDLQRAPERRSFFGCALRLPESSRDLHKGGHVRCAGILAGTKAIVFGAFSLLASEHDRELAASGSA